MKDSDWEILHELSQTPNLTRVAAKLFMTQPSLTKRLQHMEEEFGIAIVNRGPKGLEFTPEGKFLAEQAGAYLAFMDSLRSHLNAMKSEAGQNIIVGASYTFSKTELPELLMRYDLRHPNVRFTVVTEQSNLLFRKVLDGEIDVAILRGDYEGPVEQTCIGSDPGYLVTWKPMTEAELLASPRIAYKTNDRTQELLDAWWKEHFGAEMPEGMNVGYVDVALQLAGKGLGYLLCFLPQDYENPDHLCLTPLLCPDGMPLVRRTWLVRSEKARYLNETVRDFIRFLQT